MNELEQKLKNARLSAPSVELDRRIDAAFAAARQPNSRKPPFWWWIAALTAAGGATAAFVFSARPSVPPTKVAIYRIEAQGQMREMLLDRAETREVEPNFVFRVITQ